MSAEFVVKNNHALLYQPQIEPIKQIQLLESMKRKLQIISLPKNCITIGSTYNCGAKPQQVYITGYCVQEMLRAKAGRSCK